MRHPAAFWGWPKAHAEQPRPGQGNRAASAGKRELASLEFLGSGFASQEQMCPAASPPPPWALLLQTLFRPGRAKAVGPALTLLPSDMGLRGSPLPGLRGCRLSSRSRSKPGASRCPLRSGCAHPQPTAVFSLNNPTSN